MQHWVHRTFEHYCDLSAHLWPGYGVIVLPLLLLAWLYRSGHGVLTDSGFFKWFDTYHTTFELQVLQKVFQLSSALSHVCQKAWYQNGGLTFRRWTALSISSLVSYTINPFWTAQRLPRQVQWSMLCSKRLHFSFLTRTSTFGQSAPRVWERIWGQTSSF